MPTFARRASVVSKNVKNAARRPVSEPDDRAARAGRAQMDLFLAGQPMRTSVSSGSEIASSYIPHETKAIVEALGGIQIVARENRN